MESKWNQMESNLSTINDSANSILNGKFNKPSIFTNSLLNAHNITDLIRDADDTEIKLFKRVNGITVEKKFKDLHTLSFLETVDKKIKNESDVAVLCEVLFGIDQKYGVPGLQEKIADIMNKYESLVTTIAIREKNITKSEKEYESLKGNLAKGHFSMDESIDELIRDEEMRIAQLEARL